METKKNQTKHNPVTQGYYYLHYERSMWRRFKSTCARQGLTMKEVIMSLIDGWVNTVNKRKLKKK